MSWGSWLLWATASTIVFTSVMAASQGLRITRINIPYMLGTMLTPDRDRAKSIGFVLHMIAGLLFSLFYIAIFHAVGRATWWLGITIGFFHAAFVLTAFMRQLPGIHPRMASEQQGPSPTRQLEPPGFLALNYGVQTPLSVALAHLIFGAILGGFYSF